MALHQTPGIALEVPPVVMVDETGGGDAGAGRQGAQLRLLGRVERPIDSLELVVLVFAHDTLERPRVRGSRYGTALRIAISRIDGGLSRLGS